MEENINNARSGNRLKIFLLNIIANIFMNVLRLFAVSQSGGIEDTEQANQGRVKGLLNRVKSRPVMALIAALILVTIGAVVVYPRTIAPKPVPTSTAKSKAVASPTQVASSKGNPTPAVQGASGTPAASEGAPQRKPAVTPIPVGTSIASSPNVGTPSVPKPTPPSGASQGTLPPPPPTATISRGGPASGVPTVRPDLPPGTSTGSRPSTNQGQPTPANPTATQVPSPTSTPTITPTPGPATWSISVPTLQGGSGYYYVIKARSGTIAANWKVSGGSAQMFLYQGTPFGQGSGIAGTPLGGSISQSNINASSLSIVPINVSAGTYTLYFYSGAVNAVNTTSASATYTAEPGSIMTPAPSSSATPTSTNVAGATPTRTPTPLSGTTATPTNTPVPPTPTSTAYPALNEGDGE